MRDDRICRCEHEGHVFRGGPCPECDCPKYRPAYAGEHDAESLPAFERKYEMNCFTIGAGLAAEVNLACPFCGGPGYAQFMILHAADELARERACSICERAGRVSIEGSGIELRAFLVQVSGLRAPGYIGAFRSEG